MTTLFLLDSLGVGGSERKSIRLINEFSTRGRSMFLAYLNKPDTLLPQVQQSILTACLRRQGKFSFAALQRLNRIVEGHDVSLIVCVNLYPLLYAMALRVWPSKRSVKVVLAINVTDFQRTRDRFWMTIFRPLIRLCDTVVYGCEYQKQLWENRYGLRGVRSTVIYNGVDIEHFDPRKVNDNLRQDLGLENCFLIGCIARLAPEKNQEVLLRVVAKLATRDNNVHLLLVGTGPERDNLESLASSLDIGKQVHFTDMLEDVRPALSALDVFVLPSKAVETFSNAALEAMAMAVPVIISRVGGAAEMVADNENGFLYEKHDFPRLLSLVQQLMDNRKLCSRLGRAARDVVLRRFTFQKMIAEYQTLIENVEHKCG